MKRRRLTLGLLTAAVFTAGCGPGFDPYNRLNSLRVLAIRSEPSAPASGEATTITASVYTPDGTPPAYDWSWCPFVTAAGAPCPISETDLAALTGVTIPYHLSSDPTAMFMDSIPDASLEAACAARPGIPAPDCTDGFPIQIKLTVTTADDEVQAFRQLRLRFRAEQAPNANPALDHLYAIVGDADPASLQDVLAPLVLPRHVETVIGAVLADGGGNGAESYAGKDDNGNPAQLVERLNLSWFVENGTTNHERTTFIDGQIAIEDATKIKWTPAFKKDYASSTARVVVIIRDNRDGVGWIDGLVKLREAP